MKPLTKLYLERSINELKLSKILLNLSSQPNIQEQLGIKKAETFYSATITHSYYCIFYATKAYLISKKIQTKAPEEHKKTYEEFEKLTKAGQIDFELLKIYESILIKADALLEILKIEKSKRGKFTYKKIPQANLEPAKESSNNAEFFFKHLNRLCET